MPFQADVRKQMQSHDRQCEVFGGSPRQLNPDWGGTWCEVAAGVGRGQMIIILRPH